MNKQEIIETLQVVLLLNDDMKTGEIFKLIPNIKTLTKGQEIYNLLK